MRKLIGIVQRGIGESAVGAAIALRLRNQCHAIIGNHLNDGPNFETNGEKWFAEQLAESTSVFVDVGANVGSWAMLFLQATRAPVLALLIEPGASAIATLRQRFRNNPVVEIVEAAASSQVGQALFYEEPSAGQTSSLICNFARRDSIERMINVTTVDVELSRRKIKYADVLKVDAEGYDFHVLRGTVNALKTERIGVIQFEYNKPWADAGSTLAGALNFLKKFGYTTYLLKSKGLYLFNYAEYGEYYAYSNFVAVAPHKFADIAPYVRGKI
jgi:FkbM family methyltransferase